MKQRLFAALLVLIMLPLIVLPILYKGERYVCGQLRIPAADIYADVYTTEHGPGCGCSAPLWHGGIASTEADLSGVQVDDMAAVTLLDGTRLVLECVDIVPCFRLGCWLISWQGIVRANGDVLLYTDVNGLPFVRVLHLARL